MNDFAPVTLVLQQKAVEDESARRIQIPLDLDAKFVVREAELADRALTPLLRNEAQRFFVHGRVEAVGLTAGQAHTR